MIVKAANRRPFKELHEAKVRGHAKRGFRKRLDPKKIESNLERSEIRLASTRAIQRAIDRGAQIPPKERKKIRQRFDKAEKGNPTLWKELKELFPRAEDYRRVRRLYYHFLIRIYRARKSA